MKQKHGLYQLLRFFERRRRKQVWTVVVSEPLSSPGEVIAYLNSLDIASSGQGGFRRPPPPEFTPVISDIYSSRLTTIRIPGFSRRQYPTLTPCKQWRLDGYRRPSEETDEADSNRDAGQLPSQLAAEPTWRTRVDLFEQVWPELKDLLDHNPGLEAKQLFEYLQRQHPGAFADGQLRTLQRRVKVWRALEGPAKEACFPQLQKPGHLGQSDFTDLSSLGVTLQGPGLTRPTA